MTEAEGRQLVKQLELDWRTGFPDDRRCRAVYHPYATRLRLID